MRERETERERRGAQRLCVSEEERKRKGKRARENRIKKDT